MEYSLEDKKKYYADDGFWFHDHFNKIKTSEINCVTGSCNKCGAMFATYSKSRYELDEFVKHSKTHSPTDKKLIQNNEKPKKVEGKMYYNDDYQWFNKYFDQTPSIMDVLTGSCRDCGEFIDTFENTNYCLDKFDRHIKLHILKTDTSFGSAVDYFSTFLK